MPVSWESKKQYHVTLSSSEAEYVAASLATQELIWIRRILEELGYKQVGATELFEDNKAAIEVSRNPKLEIQDNYPVKCLILINGLIFGKNSVIIYC